MGAAFFLFDINIILHLSPDIFKWGLKLSHIMRRDLDHIGLGPAFAGAIMSSLELMLRSLISGIT